MFSSDSSLSLDDLNNSCQLLSADRALSNVSLTSSTDDGWHCSAEKLLKAMSSILSFITGIPTLLNVVLCLNGWVRQEIPPVLEQIGADFTGAAEKMPR